MSNPVEPIDQVGACGALTQAHRVHSWVDDIEEAQALVVRLLIADPECQARFHRDPWNRRGRLSVAVEYRRRCSGKATCGFHHPPGWKLPRLVRVAPVGLSDILSLTVSQFLQLQWVTTAAIERTA